MPKVSIIIPVYNVEKYLDKCIESVINQTLKDIEIILVDDESPDNCPQMCDQYAKNDSRIKVIHKKNEGLGHARNSGIELATGEYITFLDSDDYIDIKSCETAYNEAKNNNLDICTFSYYRFDDKGRITEPNNYDKRIIFDGREEILQYLLDIIGPKITVGDNEKFSMSSCHAIFRRKIFIDKNIRFLSERDIASEDLIFQIDYIPHTSKIGYIPEKFYYYYYNPNSITSNYSEAKYRKLLKLLSLLRERLSNIFEYEIYKEHYLYQVLRISKVIVKFESRKHTSLLKRIKRLRKECDNEYIKLLCEENIANSLSTTNRVLLFCFKHKITLPIIVIYTLFKK